MSESVYTVTVALASLKNVPPLGEQAAYHNGWAACPAEQPIPDFIIPTEFWNHSTRTGFDRALPNNMRRRGLSPLHNSTALYYNAGRWRTIRTGSLLLHGFVAGSFGIVSDPRRMPWGTFEHLDTGRRLVVGAVHLAPKGSRKGPRAEAASRRAHVRANARLEDFLERTGHPVLLCGDWNTTSPGLGDGSVGVGIDRVVRQHGDFARFGAAVVTTYRLAHSDHPGVRVSVPVLGGGR